MAVPKSSYKHSYNLQNMLKIPVTLKIRSKIHTVLLSRSSDSFVNSLLNEQHLLLQAELDFYFTCIILIPQRISTEANGNH